MAPAAVVAPFAGAWIETTDLQLLTYAYQSLPSRERGLKLMIDQFRLCGDIVAPFAGAWIETMSCTEKGWTKWGAPYLGAKTGTE